MAISKVGANSFARGVPGRMTSALLPQFHALTARAHLSGALLQVALKRRLGAISAACHIGERRGEVERAQISLDPEYLAAVVVEKDHRRHVGHVELARPGVGAAHAAAAGRELGARTERGPRYVDSYDLRQHLVAPESLSVQLVAGRAVGRLEDHRERPVSLLAPQVVRRPQ